MIVWENKSIETHSNEKLYESEPTAYIIDDNTTEGAALIEKIRSNYPYFDMVIDDGNLVDVTPYNPISATTDKSQIIADGTDICTITATVDDPTSTEMIELYHGETLVDSKPSVNGVATFEITMTEPGTLTLTVKSTTKYGQADVTIEGV
jgi:hypothetical protein